jgi:hypothetical protein
MLLSYHARAVRRATSLLWRFHAEELCHTQPCATCMDGQYEVHVPAIHLAYETRWLCLDIRIHCWPTHTHPADHPTQPVSLALSYTSIAHAISSSTSSASSLPPPAASRYLRAPLLVCVEGVRVGEQIVQPIVSARAFVQSSCSTRSRCPAAPDSHQSVRRGQ